MAELGVFAYEKMHFFDLGFQREAWRSMRVSFIPENNREEKREEWDAVLT